MPSLRLPRIYYVHPWLLGPLADWGAALDGVADMGFDHVLIAPPFASGGSVFLTSDFDQLHPALGGGPALDGIRTLASLCQDRGLSLLVDLQLDRVAPQSTLAAANPSWFLTRATKVDPRMSVEDRGGAFFRFDQPEVYQAALSFWTGLAQSLVDAGISGFRCEGLADTPPGLLRELIARLLGRAVFIGGTTGLAWQVLDKLAGIGFDAVIASTPWWDYRAPWLLESATA